MQMTGNTMKMADYTDKGGLNMTIFTRHIWPSGAYEINCPEIDARCQYMGMSKKEAIRRFRLQNKLKKRHVIVIEI